MELVRALEHWAELDNRHPSHTYCWIDLFSLNQDPALHVHRPQVSYRSPALCTRTYHTCHTSHNIKHLPVAHPQPGPCLKHEQAWWSSTFVNGIRSTEKVVLVLAPWSDPLPLSRAWCLWEIFHASQASDPFVNTAFDVAVSKEQEAALADAIAEGGSAIMPLLSEIDCSKAQARLEEDRAMIMAAIDSGPGMTEINASVLDQMRTWLTGAVERVMAQRAPAPGWVRDKTQIDFRRHVAVLLSAAGYNQESLTMRREVLAACVSLHGNEAPETLRALNALGVAYLAEQDYERALPHLQKATAARRLSLGPEHPDYLATYVCVYELHAKFDVILYLLLSPWKKD